jgi:hypothetical protein
VQEFGFELALCAHLEREREAVVSRQLGTSPHGSRVVDTVLVEPGPDFAERAAITPETIPPAAIEGNAGSGEARYWKDALDCHPERAEEVRDRALAVGFFERDRRGGRTYVRQTTRYPEDWFGRLVGIENKPDLDRPGDLATQLRKDVSLGLLDAVVLATTSYVTGAHLNRLPEAVGVWRFDPETGAREVVREPAPLATDEPGVDVLDRRPARTEIRPVDAATKARHRRRVAERAYGKGWRTDAFPECVEIEAGERFGVRPLPYCAWKDRLVNPAAECGSDCPRHNLADPPAVDVEGERAAGQPWHPDPRGRARRQSGLDRWS